jgi:hypothetical protein
MIIRFRNKKLFKKQENIDTYDTAPKLNALHEIVYLKHKIEVKRLKLNQVKTVTSSLDIFCQENEGNQFEL